MKKKDTIPILIPGQQSLYPFAELIQDIHYENPEQARIHMICFINL